MIYSTETKCYRCMYQVGGVMYTHVMYKVICEVEEFLFPWSDMV